MDFCSLWTRTEVVATFMASLNPIRYVHHKVCIIWYWYGICIICWINLYWMFLIEQHILHFWHTLLDTLHLQKSKPIQGHMDNIWFCKVLCLFTMEAKTDNWMPVEKHRCPYISLFLCWRSTKVMGDEIIHYIVCIFYILCILCIFYIWHILYNSVWLLHSLIGCVSGHYCIQVPWISTSLVCILGQLPLVLEGNSWKIQLCVHLLITLIFMRNCLNLN